MSEINIVPYIDVMLVLLVVFMIAAPLLTQGVKVDLPKVAAAPVQSERDEPLIVTVDRTGNTFVDFGDNRNSPVSADALEQRVGAVLRNRPATPVLVRGDRQANYGDVLRAMAVLQRAGAPSVGLVTEPPPGNATRPKR